MAHPAYSVMALVSLGNFLIFFFGMRNMRRYNPKEIYRRRTYAKSVKQGQKNATTHKCAICGRTEKDGDDLCSVSAPNAMEIMNTARIICLRMSM